MDLIQTVLSEFMADKDLEEGEDIFLAQQMLQKAKAGVHKGQSGRRVASNHRKNIMRKPNETVAKKVTFAGDNKPSNRVLDSERSLENIEDEE